MTATTILLIKYEQMVITIMKNIAGNIKVFASRIRYLVNILIFSTN